MEFLEQEITKIANIKVIGLGGGGGNAVNYMAKHYKSDVEYICANTDLQALNALNVDKKIELGPNTTKGLGAGMKISIGKKAALESIEEIRNSLVGADKLFISATMGGGTGTSAAPIVAKVAKELGILTTAIVTKPLSLEGSKKMRMAEQGIAELSNYVNSIIVLPNDKLIDTLPEDTLLDINETFKHSDEVLAKSVNSITELTSSYGRMNVDFSDIKTIMSISGKAMIGIGLASGENRAVEAVKQALSNPLVEQVNLLNARGILINIAANKVGFKEIHNILSEVNNYSHEDAYIKPGTIEDSTMDDDEIRVTIIATGLEQNRGLKLTGHIDDDTITSDNNTKHTAIDKQDTFITAEKNKPDNYKKFDKKDIPAYIRNNILS